ncbi:MAG: 3-phosphoshikimate 1-carboxyvinyltransferase, partial [Erysipelotrichaceae bacterium]
MIRIYPGKVKGSVTLPSSKSISHRALICAALSDGVSVITNTGSSKDIEATVSCLKKAGVNIEYDGFKAVVKGGKLSFSDEVIDCNESGSTMRFLIPLFTLDGDEKVFTGRGKLMSRPQSVYEKFYRESGGEFYLENEKLHVKGPLKSGSYELAGDISSQFFTGLLLVLPLLKGDSELAVKGRLESKSYINLTMSVMADFGVNVYFDGSVFKIKGNQRYHSRDYEVEGDYSSAAFIKLLNEINAPVDIKGLKRDSLQGDRAFFDFCEKIKKDGDIFFDIADCPDLGPALMVLSCLSGKDVGINNIARLRYKESDRVDCMIEELSKFGFKIDADENSMLIHKGEMNNRDDIVVNAHNDHRIAMALSCLA